MLGLASGRLTSIWAWGLRRRGVVHGPSLVCHGGPIARLHPDSRIEIGERVVLTSSSKRTALGVNHPIVLRTLRAGARIRIGDDVGMSGGSICAAYDIEIGHGTLLGANVTIADTDFHPTRDPKRRYAPMPEPIVADRIRIGANVFIGTNSVVLKGVELGDNCVVGAASVVTCSFPAGSIVAGSPARLVGTGP